MEQRNEAKAESDVENAIAEALMEKLVAEIPEVMFETETDNFVRDYETRLRQSGLDLNTYLKYTGLTIDALRAQMRPQAEKQVKVRLALEKIASLEALTATEEETNEEIEKISAAYGIPAEQVKAMIPVEDLNADIVVGKALKLVRENAKVAAPKAKRTTKKAAPKAEEAAEEAPKAKKTTTKKTTTKKAAKAEDAE
jgi:trigger factor